MGALHAEDKELAEEAEMKANKERETKSGVPGAAKKSMGLRREEGVRHAKCSQEVKLEKFRDTVIAFDSMEWRTLMTLTEVFLMGL